MSATIGLGNIAGVAVAVSLGGPGAVFWMIIIAFFSMSAKFVSCTLGQMYRNVSPDGKIDGGPMHYLDQGLKQIGFSTLGKMLGTLYAIFIIGGAFGGGKGGVHTTYGSWPSSINGEAAYGSGGPGAYTGSTVGSNGMPGIVIVWEYA